MKSILISTSSLWNCGDDFIRMGVLELLRLRGDVRQIWWNRAYGVEPTFANDLTVNLPHIDYLIFAGTPEWVERNEALYQYALRRQIPIALIGVGMRGCAKTERQHRLMRRVAASGLVEVCMARDHIARDYLQSLGFSNVRQIPDPAFFLPTIECESNLNIVCWRDLRAEMPNMLLQPRRAAAWCLRGRRVSMEKASILDEKLQRAYDELPDPKLVIVHDNREIARAETLFGSGNVFYATDHIEILRRYARARLLVGARIHGAVASIVHGAVVKLYYGNEKAAVIDDSIDILANGDNDLRKRVQVEFIDTKGRVDESVPVADGRRRIWADRIAQVKDEIRVELLKTRLLSSLIQD